jgi:hypothetical protein
MVNRGQMQNYLTGCFIDVFNCARRAIGNPLGSARLATSKNF